MSGCLHLKSLKLLNEENICQQYYLVSQDPVERKINNFMVIHWETFLKMLWQGELV